MQPIKKALRTAVILTGAYVSAGTIENLGGIDQLVLKGAFTLGSLTSCDIKVEFSDGGDTFQQETVADSVSAGVTTVVSNVYRLSASQNFWIPIPLACVNRIKVSAIGNGTATGSSLSIDAIYVKTTDPAGLS